MIENTLHHLSRNCGMWVLHGCQNDPSFALCKVLEEIYAIDSTQFSLQYCKISTCLQCGWQEQIKEDAADNVILLPVLKNKSMSELIHMVFSDGVRKSDEKELASNCGKVAEKEYGKVIQAFPKVL